MSVIILFCLSFLLVEYISWHFKGEKVQKNTQIVMCFLLLFIFFGFRDLPILNDTAHYYRHVRHLFSNTPFDNTPWYTFDSSSNFEEGFQIFLRIIGLVISKEPYSLIIITSFITTASLLWFLNKSTSHVAFAVFVLMTSTLLLGCYSAIRQSLAVSVSYIFYWCYGDSKYLVTGIFPAIQFEMKTDVRYVTCFEMFLCKICCRAAADDVIPHNVCFLPCCFIIFTATSIKKRLKRTNYMFHSPCQH